MRALLIAALHALAFVALPAWHTYDHHDDHRHVEGRIERLGRDPKTRARHLLAHARGQTHDHGANAGTTPTARSQADDHGTSALHFGQVVLEAPAAALPPPHTRTLALDARTPDSQIAPAPPGDTARPRGPPASAAA